ncbi:MAG: SAM-dependent methyltransferase [Alphaproteobacteria bacterium]|nr:MAG: SAM-dependent methyltransferase [Alphaproteobacteria bacterium]
MKPSADLLTPSGPAAAGGRLPGTAPLVLETAADDDYALLDSGNGRKLERYGQLIVERPESQALWRPALDPARWAAADAVFTGEADEDGIGRWRFPRRPLGETWPLRWNGLDYLGRFTAFRHVGVFAEQAAHWRFVETAIAGAGRPVKLLNLFAYTGIASLVAARAGAHVTHVDASKKAIGWARENQAVAGLSARPIRWICDDAVKFCEREARRGNRYDAILLDPPKYGRGPKGETWHLFEDLPRLLDIVAGLISDRPLFVVLTAYSIRVSFFALHELMQDILAGKGGRLESGELVIRTEGSDRLLATSLFSRWMAS